jgi:hypothetical protein
MEQHTFNNNSCLDLPFQSIRCSWSDTLDLEPAMGKTVPSFVPQRLLVASSAAMDRPVTSVALAQANNWKPLMVPSLLVGNIGYAIAS